MATQEQFLAVLARIDTATTGIAEQLRAAAEQIKNQGLPKEVEDSVLLQFEDAAAKLEAVGKPETPAGGGEGDTPIPA